MQQQQPATGYNRMVDSLDFAQLLIDERCTNEYEKRKNKKKREKHKPTLET